MAPRGSSCAVLAAWILVGCSHTPIPAVPRTKVHEGAPRFGSATYGTAHPILIQAASRRWEWLVACQPREDTDGDGRIELSVGRHGETFGDEPRAYFFAQPGRDEPIERLLARDASGRFVAFVQGGRRVVYDASTRARLDLDRAAGTTWPTDDEAEDPRRSALASRRVELSKDGHAFVIRSTPSASEVISIEIASGSSQRLYSTTFPLWSLELSDDERSIRLEEVTADTNRDGLLELPNVLTNLSKGACRRPAMSFSRLRRGGDTPVARVLPRSIPENVAPVEASDERLEGVARSCSPDGRAPIASDLQGNFLLASSPYDPFDPDFGPVEWVQQALVKCPSWVELPPCRDDQPPASFCDLSEGHGSAPDDVWALEPGRMVHYDGSTWTQIRDPLFESARGVFAVRRDRAWAFGKAGTLLSFDGSTWRRVAAPSKADLVSLWATPSGRLWIATNQNELFKGDGARWSREAVPEDATALDFWSSGTSLFAITSKGTLWKRSTNWRREGSLLAPHAIYRDQLRDLAGTSASDLWISTRAGRLIHFDGTDFSSFDSATNQDFERIVAVNDRDIFVFGGWSMLRFRRP